MAAALALPAVKVAWTVGGGHSAWEVFAAMEPANWPDVLIGMMLTNPLLSAVFAVVLSRTVFAYFAARGSVPYGRSTAAVVRSLALTLVTPVAVGILMAVFFGAGWGIGTGLASFLLRQGLVGEYRARRGRAAAGDTRRLLITAGRWTSALLAALLLPLAALTAALDGESWVPVVHCTVDTGEGPGRQRVMELGRQGQGVFGWSTDADEIVTGINCARDPSRVVRDPWWRQITS